MLYFSSFYEVTLRSAFWHAFLHLHFVVIGALLMWPLVGIDPMPGRISYPLRLLMMFLMLPFHAFLGISIMSSTQLIAEDWYLAFNRTWPPSPLDDQYLAGAIMWGIGRHDGGAHAGRAVRPVVRAQPAARPAGRPAAGSSRTGAMSAQGGRAPSKGPGAPVPDTLRLDQPTQETKS